MTCLPALPVILLVIPLPLPPNKCPRQGEHPKVLNSSWSSSPPSVNFSNNSGALKSYWVSEHSTGILSAAHSVSLAFLKELISTWTSQDLPASFEPENSSWECHQKPAIKSSPTFGNSFLLCPLQAQEPDCWGDQNSPGPTSPFAQGAHWGHHTHLGTSCCPPAPARHCHHNFRAQGQHCPHSRGLAELSGHSALQESPVGDCRPRPGARGCPAVGVGGVWGSVLPVSPLSTAVRATDRNRRLINWLITPANYIEQIGKINIWCRSLQRLYGSIFHR